MKYSMIAMMAVLHLGIAAADDTKCDDACKEARGWPVPTHEQQPRYPEAAADRHVEGCVVVSFVITPKGLADQYQILDSQPKGVFDAATLKALNDWTFKVPKKAGRYAQRIDYRMGDLADKACDHCAEKATKLACMEQPTFDQLNGSKGK